MNDPDEVFQRLAEFVRRLRQQLPFLAPVLESHLDDWDGEILSYDFMWRLGQWSVDIYRREPESSELIQLLAFLEDECGNDERIDDLIGAGYLEALPFPGEEGWRIRLLLGSTLRSWIELIAASPP